MGKTIEAHDFVALKKQVAILNRTYTSVNDRSVRNVVVADVVAKVKELLPENDDTERFLAVIQAPTLTKAQAERELARLREYVTPFPVVSSAQLAKLFKKVKKLPEPNWNMIDRYESSYLGWDDHGSQRKYLVAPHAGKLVGVYGEFDPKPLNGLCAICHQLGTVSMFLSKVKARGADGNYTKRGNLICRDSFSCNAQLSELEYLDRFIETTLVQ